MANRWEESWDYKLSLLPHIDANFHRGPCAYAFKPDLITIVSKPYSAPNLNELFTLSDGHSPRLLIPTALWNLTLQTNSKNIIISKHFLSSNFFFRKFTRQMLSNPRWCISLWEVRQGNRDLRGVFPKHHKDVSSHRDILERWCRKFKMWVCNSQFNLGICALFLAYGMSSGAAFLKWLADERSVPNS